MFLDKLQSGCLLLETQQGLVRVELSFWQRIYLLWTFRNFRALSIPLLNPRQRSLVDSLFRNSARLVSHSRSSLPVIGVVEGFAPLPTQDNSSPTQQPALKPVRTPATKPTLKTARQGEVVAPRREIAPKPIPAPSSSPKVASSSLPTPRPATPRLATALGALSLCIVSVVAWHRIQGIPASQAHSQPRIEHINAVALPNSPPAAESANVAAVETRTSISPLQASRPIVAPKAETASEAPAKPASITTAAVVATSIPGSIQTSVPTAKPIRIHDAAPTPKVSLSSQNNGLQASRPPLHFVYPDYPDVRARGIVSLTAGLDSNGAVRSVRVVSGNRALAAAAVRAVRQWRYRPYLKDGQPVATETNIVISFISEDAVSMTFPPTIPAVH